MTDYGIGKLVANCKQLNTLKVINSSHCSSSTLELLLTSDTLENINISCCLRIQFHDLLLFCQRKKMKTLSVCPSCLHADKRDFEERIREVNPTVEVDKQNCEKYVHLFY